MGTVVCVGRSYAISNVSPYFRSKISEERKTLLSLYRLQWEGGSDTKAYARSELLELQHFEI